MDREDQELLEAYRRGDERALAVLLERQAPSIYRFGVKMCRDPEDAKDVVQDTLLAAARGLRDFRGASSLSTWLYTVARSFCIKKRRKAKDAPDEMLSLDDEACAQNASADAPPDEAAAGREIGASLDRAIRSLDPASREVLLLRDVEGLTAPEVAEVLGTSVAAVKSRLHRARAVVRARLGPLVGASETAGLASPPPCPDVVRMLSRYLEGEIGPEQCAEMERHVASCPRCDAACTSLERTLALCRTAGRAGELPARVQELVRQAVREAAAAGPSGSR